MIEAEDAGFTELKKAVASLVGSLLNVGTGLGEKFVGKADDLLFEGFGKEVTMWQREILTDDLLTAESSACVALTNASMTFIAFLSHDVGTKDAVTDVGFGTETLDARGVGEEYANIVKHGGFVEKVAVDLELGMAVGYLQCLTCYTLAMNKKDIAKFRSRLIVFINDFKYFHRQNYHRAEALGFR